MKTSELIGSALDWAVASIEKLPSDILLIKDGLPVIQRSVLGCTDLLRCEFGTSWSQGGPIIERERIGILMSGLGWQAGKAWEFFESNSYAYHREHGPTPLVAAMRSYVASKLGDEIEIPDGLESEGETK